MKIEPKAFIAIEQSMAAAMKAVWRKLSHEAIAALKVAIDAGHWSTAHQIADQIVMKGVVSEVRPKLEELAVSALLFGAHHVTGDVKETAHAKGAPVPPQLKNAVELLVHQVEHDGADVVRNQLHRAISKLQQADKTTHFQKANPYHDAEGKFTSADNVGSKNAASISTKSQLEEFASGQLPSDNEASEYFYHSVRRASELESIAKDGVKPGQAGKSWFSKDEIRDRGGGYVVVRAPRGTMEEGVDRVESGLSYREFTTTGTIPSSDIVRVVGVHKYGEGGHSVREDELAKYILEEKGDLPKDEVQELGDKYKHWIEIAKGSAKKDDISDGQLAETGGLMSPEQASTIVKRRKAKKAAGLKTLYIRRDLKNADQFQAWAKEQGFTTTLPPDDLHVTVCYSKEPVDWYNMGEAEPELFVEPTAVGVHQFGKGAIVLQFWSNELHDRHFALRAKGVSSDFPDYKSHVTITYDPPEGLDLSKVKPYDGPLVFGPEIFQEVKGDWKDGLEEEVLKAETSLADQLNDAVLNGGDMTIDIGANLTTSRLVSFGFLSQAVDSGVKTYQVNEVLDGKTCPVCRYMHGKTFDVAAEYGRQLQALGASDPRDLQSIAPWPDQSKDGLPDFVGLDLGELQSQGYGSPPYHPGCRGMLALAGAVEEEVPVGDMGALSTLMGWVEDRVSALQNAVDDIAERSASPENEYDDGDKKWTDAKIDELRWARFDVTDPAAFKEIDDAFEAEDYDKAQELLDDWKAGKVSKDQGDDGEGWDGPNSPKKKRKPHAHSGAQQDYNDIKPDSSNVAFDDGAPGQIDDVNAPIDTA